MIKHELSREFQIFVFSTTNKWVLERVKICETPSTNMFVYVSTILSKLSDLVVWDSVIHTGRKFLILVYNLSSSWKIWMCAFDVLKIIYFIVIGVIRVESIIWWHEKLLIIKWYLLFFKYIPHEIYYRLGYEYGYYFQ